LAWWRPGECADDRDCSSIAGRPQHQHFPGPRVRRLSQGLEPREPSPRISPLNLSRSPQTYLGSARSPIPRFPKESPAPPRRGFRFSWAVMSALPGEEACPKHACRSSPSGALRSLAPSHLPATTVFFRHAGSNFLVPTKPFSLPRDTRQKRIARNCTGVETRWGDCDEHDCCKRSDAWGRKGKE
jgi:hypothetical protein